jgi:hypothetical protein
MLVSPLPYRILQTAEEHILLDPRRIAVPKAFCKYFLSTRSDDESGLENVKSPNWYILLKPTQSIVDLFGINKEILCLVSDYPDVQVRTFDYADKMLGFYGHRVTDDAFILISAARDVAAFCRDYLNRTGRTVILSTWDEVLAADEDFAIRLLRNHLFSRDVFDQKSPVSNDFQFFARNKTVDEIIDDLKNGQNAGIFGLRKTGKTSVLQRVLAKHSTQNEFVDVFVDAESPTFSEGTAASVALELARRFDRELRKITNKPRPDKIPDQASLDIAGPILERVIEDIVGQRRLALLVIDELERILPHAQRPSGWDREYLKLWRLLRALSQSLSGRFVFLVASTNPYFVEEPIFQDEDNPLYAFVKATYLGLFTYPQLSDMLSTLGRRMGINFDSKALEILFDEYGGHPYLSRRLCSFIAATHPERPLTVTSAMMQTDIGAFFEQIVVDHRGILQVFKEYYPDEHSLMELLAEHPGDTRKLLEQDPLVATHLKGYGIITVTSTGRAEFAIRSLKDYFLAPARSAAKPVGLLPEVSKRYEDLAKRTAEIEIALRALVQSAFKLSYQNKWRDELLRHVGGETAERLSAKTALSSQQFMEELQLQELINAVLSDWKTFQKVFYDKPELKRKSSDVLDARRCVAHHKYEEIREDATYFRLGEGCRWVLQRLQV